MIALAARHFTGEKSTSVDKTRSQARVAARLKKTPHDDRCTVKPSFKKSWPAPNHIAEGHGHTRWPGWGASGWPPRWWATGLGVAADENTGASTIFGKPDFEDRLFSEENRTL